MASGDQQAGKGAMTDAEELPESPKRRHYQPYNQLEKGN
jgi:hypothetical protein